MDIFRYTPDPGRERGMLALINSPKLFGAHESEREFTKKLLVSRIGALASEFLDSIRNDSKLLAAAPLLVLTIKSENDVDGEDRKDASEVLRIDGDGFCVIAHVVLPV